MKDLLMNEYTFLNLPWPPSLNRMYRPAGNRIIKSREARAYTDAVWLEVKTNRVQPIAGNVEAIYIFHPPDRRIRDFDNLYKCLNDSVQKSGWISNDSKIRASMTSIREPVKGGKVIFGLRKFLGGIDVLIDMERDY